MINTVYLVQIDTEDSEHHFYVYSYKPTKAELKKMFFEEWEGTYEKSDWEVCISVTINKHEVKHKTTFLEIVDSIV